MGDWLDQEWQKFKDGADTAKNTIIGEGVKKVGDGVSTVAEVNEKGIGGAVTDRVSDKVAEEAGDQFSEWLWGLTQSIVDATQWIFRLMIELLVNATAPQVNGEFIYMMGGRIFYIALPLIVLFAAMRIAIDSVRARALVGAGAAFAGAAASFLGTIAVVPLTWVAVRAVDAVADGLLGASLDDAEEAVDSVMEDVALLGTWVGNMVAGESPRGPLAAWQVAGEGIIATCIVCLLASLLLLISLAIIGLALAARNMLLYVVIVIAPITLSGLSWGPTRRWAGQWTGWQVALIFTKLAIVVVVGLGLLAITNPLPAEGGWFENVLPAMMTVLSGILMLLLAGFMPVACFALFGWMGEQSIGAISAAAMGAQGMLQRMPENMLKAGQSAGGRVQAMLDRASGGGQAEAGAGAAGGSGAGAGVAGGGAAGGGSGAAGAAGAGAAGAGVAVAAASEAADTAGEVVDEAEGAIEDAEADAPGNGGQNPSDGDGPSSDASSDGQPGQVDGSVEASGGDDSGQDSQGPGGVPPGGDVPDEQPPDEPGSPGAGPEGPHGYDYDAPGPPGSGPDVGSPDPEGPSSVGDGPDRPPKPQGPDLPPDDPGDDL